MFHLLCVAERGARLAVEDGRVVVRKNTPPLESFIALDDLDAVVIEENAVSLTGCFLARLAEKRIPVILCGPSRLPAALLDPVVADGADACLMLRSQVAAPLPWKKQLWRALVRAKIAGQSANLLLRHKLPMARLVPLVRSGDPDNIEGRAAAFYWSQLGIFPARDRRAPDANRFFNYAYMVLYSAFARYLCAAALHPDIGIHHHSQYNHFSLASDLMEPFRPVADRCVFRLLDAFPGDSELRPETRAALLRFLYESRVRFRDGDFRLLDGVNETVHSFKRALVRKDASLLLLPEAA